MESKNISINRSLEVLIPTLIDDFEEFKTRGGSNWRCDEIAREAELEMQFRCQMQTNLAATSV